MVELIRELIAYNVRCGPSAIFNVTIFIPFIKCILVCKMLNTFSEIPVFAVLTNMDKCTLSKNEVEEMKTQICKSINIAADKLLLCSNYQSNQRPTPEKDIILLEFLAKVQISQLPYY